MFVTDTLSDIAHDDVKGMEAAFCALLAYPNEDRIVGVADADGLVSILWEISGRLQDDKNIMPAHIFALARDELEAVVEPDEIDGSRYCDLAQHVRTHVERWRPALAPGAKHN